MRASSSRQPSVLPCTPVMSSIRASLKSVVTWEWVSAEPSAAGCGVTASAPTGRTRRLSFSMPRRMPAAKAGVIVPRCFICGLTGRRDGPLASCRERRPLSGTRCPLSHALYHRSHKSVKRCSSSPSGREPPRNGEECILIRVSCRALVQSLVASHFVATCALAAAPAPAQQAAPDEWVGKDAAWVPTPPVLVEKMLDMAQVTPQDFVMDLGSGDGRNVIAAARRGARALGVEFNPDMVELSR